MVSITIRDVPDETRAELAARAARSGQSMQEFLRARLVELAETPDPQDVLDRIRRHKAAFGQGLSVEQILVTKGADRA
ncbi:FitA-like ribbon-helix-helix domain-containing protein [Nocardioides humi]|nr:hypothetical protein [Nocardioides humi]